MYKEEVILFSMLEDMVTGEKWKWSRSVVSDYGTPWSHEAPHSMKFPR